MFGGLEPGWVWAIGGVLLLIGLVGLQTRRRSQGVPALTS